MNVSHVLDHLNQDQREAVSAAPGHYLVLAGAGSGKTRVLTHRIVWLNEVHGIPTHSMMAVTFTNKAAGEIQQRVDVQLRHGKRGMWIGTFHSLAHRLLRLHWKDAKLPEGFQVIDSDDQLRLVKRVIQSLELNDTLFPPKQAMWWINTQKDEGRRPEHIQPESHDNWIETQRRIYATYQERCNRAGLVDFAELLLRAHELLRDTPALLAHYRARFGEILIDEFQDTNTIQYAFVRVLADETGHVFAVGDDDQAIYGWRGAKVENVQHFLKDFPSVQIIRLEQNYRSSANILGAANAIIAHNPDRIGKRLWTESGDGESIDLYAAYNEIDEARYVIERARQWVRDGGSYGEIAVLYRSNAQSRAFEEALQSEHIPYRVYGGMRFFERAEIKDALAYLRLLANRSDDAAFERVVNTPARGIGERTLDEVRRLARTQSLALWDAAMACTQASTLSTRARNALAGFLNLVQQLALETSQMRLAERIDHMLLRSELREHWRKEGRGGLDSESRQENLDELVSVASRFVLPESDAEEVTMTELDAFLSYASLEGGDGQVQAGEEGVQLMTLHSAKGLEFPLVFLVGLENGLFPSARSLDEHGRLEEERRLAYVGITRARHKLILSYAEARRIHGQDNYNVPSRFLREIPQDLLHEVRPSIQVLRQASLGAVHRPVHNERDTASIKLGVNVMHPTFGSGVVVDYEGSGAHTRVQVKFDTVGTKWLVMAYANLSVV
ncbi:DNA helicase II [Xylella taiwanensis]|uniref:DNA 3'-5' helicase n=1 Tax=Xylella taiwanensis TaxID=1444770 RepID=Z9JG62_9GAMM|nr:DNA helicase II [Xylella taiwanensis]AXI82510.1 DNA-dependent helicase II [Xylella taiwanensis]EWS77385.1 DNA helicase II [Xylella taiwanensis]MCD8455502.1 DNA helicase II [Xylella taiwanensis]MCD8457908.1 DNA helicase II [Xylella taiwanensis]MCD8460043.1 DNA helicase II [Xylella taiwanensis]